MLEKADLSRKLAKAEWQAMSGGLELRLGELQRRAKDLEIPVIIVFEGWDAAGKGTLINDVLLAMDPRGFNVHPTNPPTKEELLRPFLWRFWNRIPPAGRIAVFDRSWYGRVLVEKVNRIVGKKTVAKSYENIRSFERQLTDGGCAIVKFFLHISKKEQKKRFEKLESNPITAWKVTKDDWKHHKQYEKHLEAAEAMLAETDTDFAPWTIVESHDRRFASGKIFQTIIDALERRIAGKERQDKEQAREKDEEDSKKESSASIVSIPSTIRAGVDLSLTLDGKKYKTALKKYRERVREIEHLAFRKRIPVLIVYEGWDAGGKGGNIKRLVRAMDPRGYEVNPVGAPNDVEKARHYLWRFWRDIPKAGHIAIFDRSWYGRVLVERVEGFCVESDWRRSYREINEFEEQLTDFGAVMVKFWLEISPQEQLQRFETRQGDPHKQWKITEDDWRNRKKWDQYEAAVDEMLYRTSTAYAPWTIIEANCKRHARIKAMKTVVKAVEGKL